MIVLDACVVIALLEKGHIHSQPAATIMDHEEELLLHPLTYSEILVGAVRVNSETLVTQAIHNLGIEIWSPDDAHPSRIAHLRISTRLRLPHCCVLDTVAYHGATLATFDQGLIKTATSLGWEVLTTEDPVGRLTY
ncbi:MAG: PIN domain-containing protein [Propionibacteriaceae bacterium]|jgi:predicted nucleic acid-binding protein|nr:PIN domain-containing protein [Propionibacteriaceae bacterium]